MRELAPDSRLYEMMVVVAPTVGDEGLPAVTERVSGYIATLGGTVKSVSTENPWGRRRLAYPINDHRDAFYALYMFDADAPRIVELERELKLDEVVIRHLIVRYDPMTEHEERPRRDQQGEGQPVPPARRPQAAGEGEAPVAAQATTDTAPAAPQAAAEPEPATDAAAEPATEEAPTEPVTPEPPA